MRSPAAVALALAVALLGIGTECRAEEPASEVAAARPVVLVLLTDVGATDAALTRLEAELQVAGFEPVRSELAPDASPVAVRGLASMHDAFAAVRAPDDTSEPVVWLRDPAGDYGLRQLDVPAGTPPTVSALQVVEFLSARQLELALGIPDAAPPVQTSPSDAELAAWALGRAASDQLHARSALVGSALGSAAATARASAAELRAQRARADRQAGTEDDDPLGLELEVIGAMSLSGAGANGGPGARIGWSDPATGLGPRLSWLGPLFGNDLTSPWGAIALRQEMVSLDVGLAVPLSPVSLRPWLGLAVAHVVARGDSEVDAWTPAVGTGFGTTLTLTPWLATRLDLSAFLATSPVDVRTGPDDTARIGSPIVNASLGLVLVL